MKIAFVVTMADKRQNSVRADNLEHAMRLAVQQYGTGVVDVEAIDLALFKWAVILYGGFVGIVWIILFIALLSTFFLPGIILFPFPPIPLIILASRLERMVWRPGRKAWLHIPSRRYRELPELPAPSRIVPTPASVPQKLGPPPLPRSNS